jgi:hypothetical protein
LKANAPSTIASAKDFLFMIQFPLLPPTLADAHQIAKANSMLRIANFTRTLKTVGEPKQEMAI